jgi:hypothetical protein
MNAERAVGVLKARFALPPSLRLFLERSDGQTVTLPAD